MPRLLASVVLLAALLPGCRDDSPETRIRALLERVEQAAERKELRTLADLVSPDYSDERGQTRADVVELVRFALAGQEAVHLFSLAPRLRLVAHGRAEASVVCALTARPVQSLEELQRMSAEVWRFDLELAEDGRGEWKVVRAAWRPAGVRDLL